MNEVADHSEALLKAIQIISGGNVRAASRKLNISYSTISTWISRNRKTPAEYCRQIEALTNHEITRCDLRPDVFGPNRDKEIAASNLTPTEKVIANHLVSHYNIDPDGVIQHLQTRLGYSAKEAVSIYSNIKEAGFYGE